ncbi:helix-turn-helix transcriptional regulator [bacterium]|nr:helix-turn-helix transcriptional regulator [bacterium]
MYIVNLFNIRWKKKYTQDEIMKATGLSKKTIGQLFSGKYYNYELRTIEKIAKFFDCKIHDILIEVEDEV